MKVTCVDCKEPEEAEAVYCRVCHRENADARAENAVKAEKARIVAWLRQWSEDAKKIPGPSQYEDALRDAADLHENGAD